MADLVIKDLHVSVENKEILKGLSLTVKSGERHALMGPNGNGKSTLLAAGSLTLAHSQNSQMSFMYGFFFVKFLFFTVVCVVIVI